MGALMADWWVNRIGLVVIPPHFKYDGVAYAFAGWYMLSYRALDDYARVVRLMGGSRLEA